MIKESTPFFTIKSTKTNRKCILIQLWQVFFQSAEVSSQKQFSWISFSEQFERKMKLVKRRQIDPHLSIQNSKRVSTDLLKTEENLNFAINMRKSAKESAQISSKRKKDLDFCSKFEKISKRVSANPLITEEILIFAANMRKSAKGLALISSIMGKVLIFAANKSISAKGSA